MNSLTETLVTVQYRHGYFNDQRCYCLAARPVGASLRQMLNHGLLLKNGPAGFAVLYDTRFAGRQRTRADFLKEGVVLRFVLRLADPDFYNYTDPVPDDIRKKVFYFYNRPASVFLHSEEKVSSPDLLDVAASGKPAGKKIALQNITGQPFEKPFGLLGLRLRPGLEESYQLSFQSRKTWWKYILVGSYLQELRNPAIIDAGTKESFVGPSAIRLPDERDALAFVSPAPLGLSERPAGSYMLVENFDPGTQKYKVVIAALPVPDTRVVSAVQGRVAGQPMSEIFLY